MIEVQINETQYNHLNVRIDNISYLAMIHLLAENDVLTFTFNSKSTLTTIPITTNGQQLIIDNLNKLTEKFRVNTYLPLTEQFLLEINLNSEQLIDLIDRLAISPIEELQSITEQLAELRQIDITKAKTLPEKINNATESTPYLDKITLLEADQSIENKLLFYYLYNNNSESAETVAEKINLMTMERKENLWDEIRGSEHQILLPNSVREQIFCSLEIITDINTLSELIMLIPGQLVLPQFTTKLGLVTMDEIAKSSEHATFLETMEAIKQEFTDNHNQYIIARNFKQRAILPLSLASLTKIKQAKLQLTDEILQAVTKSLPFLTSYTNNQ